MSQGQIEVSEHSNNWIKIKKGEAVFFASKLTRVVCSKVHCESTGQTEVVTIHAYGYWEGNEAVLTNHTFSVSPEEGQAIELCEEIKKLFEDCCSEEGHNSGELPSIVIEEADSGIIEFTTSDGDCGEKTGFHIHIETDDGVVKTYSAENPKELEATEFVEMGEEIPEIEAISKPFQIRVLKCTVPDRAIRIEVVSEYENCEDVVERTTVKCENPTACNAVKKFNYDYELIEDGRKLRIEKPEQVPQVVSFKMNVETGGNIEVYQNSDFINGEIVVEIEVGVTKVKFHEIETAFGICETNETTFTVTQN